MRRRGRYRRNDRGEGTSAVLTIWLCHGVCQFTVIVGADPLHEFGHGEPTRRFHDGPFPMHPRGLNRIAPGTLPRSPTNNEATAPGVFSVAVVGFDPLLYRLADVPGSMVPDANEGPFALGRTVDGKPGEKGAGDRAARPSFDTAPPHLVGCGPRAPIAGYSVALGVLGGDRLCPQAEGCVVAPGMPLGLSFTAPPPVIFAAQRQVRMVGDHWEESIPAVFCSHRPGPGGPSRVWRVAN
jgi:hypothetical protein